ncbi:MAG: hypothetical protein E2O80_03670 [Betaproteobacteria bacterium]|nr:MAG: hypothetical protein E2O80_03670 [Betaproteobacteria bacterium]
MFGIAVLLSSIDLYYLLSSPWEQNEDALHYHTGEITFAGTVSRTGCGQKMHLKRTSKIPPLYPSCHATRFLKGY